MAEQQLPTSLIEAIRYFQDPDVCVDFVASLRWPDGPICPRCQGGMHSYLKTRRVWKCRDCKHQFSVKVGTIFEDSPIKLDKWLAAIWLLANSKNGVSSHELGRAIGLTQKSAWFVLQRVRLAMQCGSFDKFDGEVEVDETFIGGKARNMHSRIRKAKITGTGGASGNKTTVAGAVRRGTDGSPSRVHAVVVNDTRQPTLHAHVRNHVAKGSHLYTDAHGGYTGLGGDYSHQTIDHAETYVRGRVHTNTMEGFWSLLKRGLHGTYTSVQPFHLFRYLDERAFTYNERGLTDLGRFTLALQGISGRRVTYKRLTGKV